MTTGTDALFAGLECLAQRIEHAVSFVAHMGGIDPALVRQNLSDRDNFIRIRSIVDFVP